MKWVKQEPTRPGYYWKVDSNYPDDMEVVYVHFVTTKNPWTQREEVQLEVRDKTSFTINKYDSGITFWSDEEVPYPDLGEYTDAGY